MIAEKYLLAGRSYEDMGPDEGGNYLVRVGSSIGVLRLEEEGEPTQKEFARRAGIKYKDLRKMESVDYVPDISKDLPEEIIKASYALGKSPDEIYKWSVENLLSEDSVEAPKQLDDRFANF